MFRRGGKVNEGIMSGIVDRTKHAENPFPGSNIDKKAIEGNTALLESILREYTPKTRLPIGEFGLNLASGMTLTDALRDPYKRFTRADDAREAAIKGGAAKLGIAKALEKDKIGAIKVVFKSRLKDTEKIDDREERLKALIRLHKELDI